MTDVPDIRDVLLDLPMVEAADRPEGMIVVRRSDVPEDRRQEADAWVAANGGLVGEIPIFTVIGGKTSEKAPPAEKLLALPIAALVQR